MADILVVNPSNGVDIQPNLQIAYNNANDGDRIILPIGVYPFSGNITTTKKVSLYSLSSTTLYRPDTISDGSLTSVSMITYNINDRNPSNIVIKGITFKSKTPSVVPDDGLSVASDYLLKFINCTDFIVTNCGFYNFGNAAIYVQHYDDLSRGLIYNNIFIQCKGYDGNGLGYGVVVFGANITWSVEPQFGSDNFIFIENNSFNSCRHATSGGGNARYVARYNNISNNLIAQGLDAHERTTSNSGTLNSFATRAVEFYNNTLINTTFKITQFADSIARAAFVPYTIGTHYGIQLDTLTTYVSTGLSAGNWTIATTKPTSPLGVPIMQGKNAQELSNNAILIRGGEALIYNNTISGFRYGIGLIDFSVIGGGAYPIPYSMGYASGLSLGSNNTGVGGVVENGDLFYWNNNFTPYVDGSHTSLLFFNYQTQYFTDGRDYHGSTDSSAAKSGYIAYTYPHPRRLKS